MLGFDKCLHQVAKVGPGIPDREENVERHRVREQHKVFRKFQHPELLESKELEVLVILGLQKGTAEHMQ